MSKAPSPNADVRLATNRPLLLSAAMPGTQLTFCPGRSRRTALWQSCEHGMLQLLGASCLRKSRRLLSDICRLLLQRVQRACQLRVRHCTTAGGAAPPLNDSPNA